jgi:hypothetical protein
MKSCLTALSLGLQRAVMGLGLVLAAGGAVAADASPEPPVSSDVTSQIAFNALALLGVDYRYGGTSPESGLDCSGLVRHVFHDALGLNLPRRSIEISRLGGKVTKAELQPGDLVFFNTLRRTFSHVGIYIGQRRFVHAPSSGGAIRVEQLDAPYWVRHFNGGRRLVSGGKPAVSGALTFAGGRTEPVSARGAAPDAADASMPSARFTSSASDTVNPL